MTRIVTFAEDRLPKLYRNAFYCAHCKVFSQQSWQILFKYNLKEMHFSTCQHCGQKCLWLGEKMLLPDVSNFPLPNADMPDNVKEIYSEAAAIANKSSRAAAALMRLALQELCKSLGSPEKTLQKDIDFLIKEKQLPKYLVEAMDIVRIFGNNAVHPGTIGIENNDDIVKALFNFINLIAEKLISEPRRTLKEIDEINRFIPDSQKRKETPQ